jgi:pyruvate formate lyase activating enzyme
MAENRVSIEAGYVKTLAGKNLQCLLCPRRCRIPPGTWGNCRVRHNRDGRGELPFYGLITALAEDPIEKKPLYHWRPGSSILSAGFAGCNLHCPFCQNWRISQLTVSRETAGRRLSPEEFIAGAVSAGCTQIAYTYSEPLVHIEYLLSCMNLARKAGMANILVSNGCLNPEPAEAVLALTDAANIDLKCFSGETYARVLGGDLAAVCGFIEKAYRRVHLELTTLVVPGLNDGEEELCRCAAFIAGLSPSIPWHLSAYHPDWRWDAPATDPLRLAGAAREARKTLSYVYTGNIAGESNDTPCPHCGGILVSRRGYRIDTSGLIGKNGTAYRCARCGEDLSIITG